MDDKLTRDERIRLEALKLSCSSMTGYPLTARIEGAKQLAAYIRGENTDV